MRKIKFVSVEVYDKTMIKNKFVLTFMKEKLRLWIKIINSDLVCGLY